jgi:hypothetical protein
MAAGAAGLGIGGGVALGGFGLAAMFESLGNMAVKTAQAREITARTHLDAMDKLKVDEMSEENRLKVWNKYQKMYMEKPDAIQLQSVGGLLTSAWA